LDLAAQQGPSLDLTGHWHTSVTIEIPSDVRGELPAEIRYECVLTLSKEMTVEKVVFDGLSLTRQSGTYVVDKDIIRQEYSTMHYTDGRTDEMNDLAGAEVSVTSHFVLKEGRLEFEFQVGRIYSMARITYAERNELIERFTKSVK